MSKLNFKNIVWKEGDYYVAQCLNVEVSSFGNTKEAALANLNEALELYFDDNEVDEFTLITNPELVDIYLEHA